jgi:hypothetical protein
VHLVFGTFSNGRGCLQVGAPPEVSARLTEIAQEVEARQRTALGGLAAATEPELDQFMVRHL